MKSFTEWRDEITQYLTTHKSFFQVNQKMSADTAHKIENHFSEKGYSVEVRKCSGCGGWDIIIYKNL